MAEPSVHGRFIWQGLMCRDPSASGRFYVQVLGWRAEAWPHDAGYTIFSSAGGPVGGMSLLSEESRSQGARERWLGFIGVDDVDSMVLSAERLGGKAHGPAKDIPEVGRIAVLTDPQGAVFALHKPLRPMPARAAAQTGEFAWNELATTDAGAAFRFYQTLFGWQLMHKMDMGPQGHYWIFGSGGVQRGGIYQGSQPMPGPAWLAYVEVPDVARTIAAATRAGGRVCNGPMDVPGGRIAQLMDPGGVAFAVHATVKAAAATPPPPPKAAAPKPAAPRPAAPKPSAAPGAPAAKPAAAPAAPVASGARRPRKAAKRKAAKAAKKSKAAPKRRAAPKRKGTGGRKAAARRAASAKRRAAPRRRAVAKRRVARRPGKSARRRARPK
jgi:predicted enzyme related to lactoylglutathione lyase